MAPLDLRHVSPPVREASLQNRRLTVGYDAHGHAALYDNRETRELWLKPGDIIEVGFGPFEHCCLFRRGGRR